MVTPSSYRPQALDTSVETDRFKFALLQQRSNSDRLQMSMALTKGARELCLCGIRQTYASHDQQDTFIQGENLDFSCLIQSDALADNIWKLVEVSSSTITVTDQDDLHQQSGRIRWAGGRFCQVILKTKPFPDG